MSEEPLIVEYSEKRRFLIDILIPLYSTLAFIEIFLPIFGLVIIPSLTDKSDNITFLLLFGFFNILFFPLLYYPLKKYINNQKPFTHTKFTVSSNEISIYIENKKYIELLWKDLEQIEVMRFGRGGFKIKFLSKNKNITTLRLYLVVYTLKKQLKIIQKLKQLALSLNKSFNEKKQGSLDNQNERKKEQNKIKSFILSQI